MRRATALCGLLLLAASLAAAPELPPGDQAPLLRLDPGGPASIVTALAFNADGTVLYAAGWDKVVRGWRLGPDGAFTADRELTFRVPVGPGLYGALNALALSADDRWLATAGLGPPRGAATLGQNGRIWPAAGLDDEARKDLGLIYAFDAAGAGKGREVRLLRGHAGVVHSLAFVTGPAGGRPLLVSLASEQNKDGKPEGVLRLWDVEGRKPLAVRRGLPNPRSLPGLVAWKTGRGATDVRAALALDDGYLRVWDVDRDLLHKVADADYNVTVVRAPDGKRLLTGAYGTGKARLALWTLDDRGRPDRPRPPADKGDCVCRALGLVSAKGDGARPLAATVVRFKKGDEYHLQLLDLAGDDFGKVRGDELLWRGGAQPVLAAIPRGKHVAVAGNRGHSILVYPVAGLLDGKNVLPQVLGSDGEAMERVAFVVKGKDRGLLVNPRDRKKPGAAPTEPHEGDLVLDLGRDRLTDRLKDWKLDLPDADGWTVKLAAEDQKETALAVARRGREVGRVTLARPLAVTEFALLPRAGPGAALDFPLLAVAAAEFDQPQLRLYNGRTGEPLRQLTGHVAPISALAFSGDGRLLASTAADQTVCVWALGDLGEHVGWHGLVPGLVVRRDEDRGGLVVDAVEAGSIVRGKLGVGDRIAGLVVGEKLRPLKTPPDLYDAVDQLKPGGKVVLRRGDPKGGDDVTLKVGQGIDERKPLFSLFLTGADKAGGRAWVAWNRLGPYEASSRRAEDYVGWHFNRGDADRPAEFFPSKEYRDTYYRKNLLGKLAGLGRELKEDEYEPARPVLRLDVESAAGAVAVEPEPDGAVRVTGGGVAFRLVVRGRKPHTLASLTWRLDDGPEQRLDPEKVPLDGWVSPPLDLARGKHTLAVEARGGPDEPEPYTASLVVRVQPEAPRINLKAPTIKLINDSARLQVKSDDFRVEAEVTPWDEGEKVRAIIRHEHRGEEVAAETTTQTPNRTGKVAVTKRLKLNPGLNTITLTARNDKALDGYEDRETSRVTLEVVLVEKASPPEIVLESYQLPPGGAGKKLARAPLVVDGPRVRLLGRITAKAKLTRAEWSREGEEPRRLTGFTPDARAEFTVREDVEFRPGERKTLVFRAAAADSDVAEERLTITYRPPAPLVVLTSPESGTVFDGEEDQTTVHVKGKVHFPDLPGIKYEAVLLVDGKPVGKPKVDARTGELTGEVRLTPVKHTIAVEVRNEWNASRSGPVTVTYVRPPVLVKLEEGPAKPRSSRTLIARVRSPLPPCRGLVHVEVNGTKVQPGEVAVKETGAKTYDVRLGAVPLAAGREHHKVLVWVANAEAECRQPGRIDVAAPALVVTLKEPGQNLTTSRSPLPVRVHVESAAALTSLRIVRQKGEPVALDVKGLKANADGSAELTGEVPLVLGENTLRVEAANADGRRVTTPPVTVTYQLPPVVVTIDRLVTLPGGKEVEPERGTAERRFPPLDQARVRLYGRVRWGVAANFRLYREKVREVRPYVNGFGQAPARLNFAAGKDEAETPFAVDLLLTRAGENQVRLRLPGLPVSEDSRRRLVLSCRKPETRLRLHLLLVSARDVEKKELETRVLKALQLPADKKKLPGQSVFSDYEVHYTLVGYHARENYILPRLVQIKRRVEEKARTEPGADVILVYYEGGEELTADGNVFAVKRPGQGEAVAGSGIPFAVLAEELSALGGASLLLLDVDRQQGDGAGVDRIARWPDDAADGEHGLGIIRYAWTAPGPRDERSLLTALQQSVKEGKVLADVTKRLKDIAAGYRKQGVNLYDDQRVAKELLLLPVRPEK